MPENTITQTISVPLDRRDDYRSVQMKQADSGRVLVVRTMFQEQYLEFPDGTTGEFRAGKPDNTYVTRTDGVNVSGSTTTIEITSNTLAVEGNVFCDVIYSLDGKTLGIANFIIEVMPGAIPKDAIESNDDWQSLSEAATAATSAANRAETAASQSEDALSEIREIEYNPVRIDPVTGTLLNWDSTSQSWVDSGISVTGAGDMLTSIYDPAGGAKQVAFEDEVMARAVFDPAAPGETKGPVELAGGILNAVYPVGSIYMSVNNTNPSTLFGGTWSAWGSGRVPVGVNTSDTDFNTSEKTGGSKTNTLVLGNLPNIYAELVVDASKVRFGPSGTGNGISSGGTYGFDPATGTALRAHIAGSSTPITNLQPYITCYMWKRTA